MADIIKLNGYNLKDSKAVHTYDTVADLKADTKLKAGNHVQTKGYTTTGDGGHATYIIVDDNTLVDDDGSVHELVNGLKAVLLDDEITPDLFGAKGDGTADDTQAVRKALKYCIDNSKVLYIRKQYYITDSLLTSDDYTDVTINLKGNYTNNSYTTNNYGGIKFANGINVFDGITALSGVIDGIVFAPVSRTQTGSIFNHCRLQGLTFRNCYVANILAFIHNCEVRGVSSFKSCRFLTVYYFGKCDDDARYGFTDSSIEDCYINGGAEMNDNICFQFVSWNGCSVRNNFIDYYHTIYEPYTPAGTSSGSELPNSVNNQYQVFRYLYWKNDNISSIVFNSIGDVFNWNDPTKLAKLTTYTAKTYTGHDSQTHDIPPYIGYASSTCIVSIKDAYLQDNLDNIIFVRGGLPGYNFSRFSFTCNGLSNFNKYNYPVTHADSFYNGDTYKANLIDLPFSKNEESIPAVPSLGWSNYYLGQRINVSNGIYRLVYNFTNSQAEWVEDHSI